MTNRTSLEEENAALRSELSTLRSLLGREPSMCPNCGGICCTPSSQLVAIELRDKKQKEKVK